MNLYLVENGTVSPADTDTAFDHLNSVIILAPDEASALRTAELYDHDLISFDNHYFHGQLIYAIKARDE